MVFFSLQDISTLLRNPQDWSEDFGPWDYSSNENCACALTYAQWGEGCLDRNEKFFTASEIARITGEYLGIIQDIFLGGIFWEEISHGRFKLSQVTPEMVADKIDNYLAQKA